MAILTWNCNIKTQSTLIDGFVLNHTTIVGVEIVIIVQHWVITTFSSRMDTNLNPEPRQRFDFTCLASGTTRDCRQILVKVLSIKMILSRQKMINSGWMKTMIQFEITKAVHMNWWEWNWFARTKNIDRWKWQKKNWSAFKSLNHSHPHTHPRSRDFLRSVFSIHAIWSNTIIILFSLSCSLEFFFLWYCDLSLFFSRLCVLACIIIVLPSLVLSLFSTSKNPYPRLEFTSSTPGRQYCARPTRHQPYAYIIVTDGSDMTHFQLGGGGRIHRRLIG